MHSMIVLFGGRERCERLPTLPTIVFLEGMDRELAAAVWEYARSNGYVIVTKDADFADMSVLRGYPPKVIWVRIGNCTTQQIDYLFRSQRK